MATDQPTTEADPADDRIEEHYRARWAQMTPDERRRLQALDGTQSPESLLDVTEDVDGIPSTVGWLANPDTGLITLPEYVRTWDPDDGDPTSFPEDDPPAPWRDLTPDE